MTTVAVADIRKFRNQFSNNPKALDALKVLESCGGDLKAAIIELANRFGEDPNIVLNLVDQQCQEWICENKFIRMALPQTLGLISNYFAQSHLSDMLSAELAIIVTIYVDLGLGAYCER
ncbi:hypothetical protein SR1949_47160 [Sphaerospermopsis reniformis]|uniref:Uncharacterized protein n=1 Tax=Sphaerospermopsis reniformis TaxID=531300 RepID=A0A480A439_9CYAN|nr:hypothetical protein [Sphaerospermopsis reniformis]GCL39589.1 hypothetical protein SR1949_47160 [Sphaerospermopsis reniformis]